MVARDPLGRGMTTDDLVTLSADAVAWLVRGEHGLSSRAIFDHLLFGEQVSYPGQRWPHWVYPLDMADFRRCELLLRQVPELRPRLPEMADLSPVWARLVPAWDPIVHAAEEEWPAMFTPRPGHGPWADCPRARTLLRIAVDGPTG